MYTWADTASSFLSSVAETKGYIKNYVPAPKIWLTLTKPVACG